jgi:predicted RNA-binding protein YlxR (DUF448 family)
VTRGSTAQHLRTCVSCRRVTPQQELLRVQVTEQGLQHVLKAGHGRSAYVHPERACIDGLAERGVAKGMRRSLRCDTDLVDRAHVVQELLGSLVPEAVASPQEQTNAS